MQESLALKTHRCSQPVARRSSMRQHHRAHPECGTSMFAPMSRLVDQVPLRKILSFEKHPGRKYFQLAVDTMGAHLLYIGSLSYRHERV
jgi:hypothetical protein